MKLTATFCRCRIFAQLTVLMLTGLASKSIAGNIVGYVANWNGNPTFVQYSKLTHINFSFAEANTNGTLNCDTTYLGSVVSKAHAAGVKVLISVGGASNGGNMTTAMRNARTNLTANIEAFVHTWNLDGADIDWEAPVNSSDGTLFNTLVQTLYTDLHPEGKLITAALDTGDWFGMYIPSSSFAYLDMLNIMAYDSGGDYYFSSGLTYWIGRGAPKAKLMMGVGFFGNGSGGEKAYHDIVASDPSAPYEDVSNGYKYNGIPSMQAKTQVAKNSAGGIMIWEISQDTAATSSTSLMNTIYNTMVSSNYAPIGKIVSLRSGANGLYVSAANSGASALIANRTNASTSEEFKVSGYGPAQCGPIVPGQRRICDRCQRDQCAYRQQIDHRNHRDIHLADQCQWHRVSALPRQQRLRLRGPEPEYSSESVGQPDDGQRLGKLYRDRSGGVGHPNFRNKCCADLADQSWS